MDTDIVAVDWTKLLPEVVVEISRHLKLLEDFIVFRSVCLAWRDATVGEKFQHKDTQIPWLMLAPAKCTSLRDFYSVSKSTVRIVPFLRQVNGGRCFSSKGWLLSVWQDWTIHLIQPFSSPRQIDLPRIKGFKNWKAKATCYKKMYWTFIDKCAVSSDTTATSDDFIVMVIYGGFRELAYCRLRDKVWTSIETWFGGYYDVIYSNNKFYAINFQGRIMVFDVRGTNPNPNVAIEIANMPFIWSNVLRCYLVQSGEDLLAVTRHGDNRNVDTDDEFKTASFKIFKVDLNASTWTQIADIGQRAIFVGHNSSFSIDTSQNSKCMANAIYFTESSPEHYCTLPDGGGNDMGIYHMEDGTITSFYPGKIRGHRITPPIWVQNNFQ